MPLPKRIIEPVHVSRNTLPDANIEGISIISELEAVTNGSLANIIRQLSSLSRHAENIFSELSDLSMDTYKRTTNLQTRITRLSVKVTALDSNFEVVSLQDIHMRKAFKSTSAVSQQLFTKDSLPAAIRDIYIQCDEPPPLNILNPYRDDGKDGLKFYTDPNYFFELWRQEMLNDTERVMQDKGKKTKPKHVTLSTANTLGTNDGRQKKRVRQPHNTRERQKQMAMTQGEYFTTPVLNTGTLQAPSAVPTTSMTVLTKAGSSATPSTSSLYSDQVIYYGTLKNQQFVNNSSAGGATNKLSLRPNSIEFQQQQHQQQQHLQQLQQQQYYNNNLNSNFKQMQLNSNNATDHYHRPSNSVNNGVLINNHNDPNEYIYQQHQMHQQEPIYGSNQLLSPSRRLRPSQPPPAPPPNQQQTSLSSSIASAAVNHHFSSSSMIRTRDQQCEYSSSSVATRNNNENSNNNDESDSNNDILPPPPPPLPPPPPPIHEDDNFDHLESNSYYYDQNGNGHRGNYDHKDSNEIVDGCLENTPPPPPPPPLPPPMPVIGQNDNENGSGSIESTTITGQTNKISIENRPLSRISNGDLLKTISTLSPPKLKPVSANIKAAVPDARNELLQAIRSGIKLRKVEKNEQKSSASNNGQNDVASIMAIRMAVEYSESDSSSQNDDDSEYDSECWAVDDNNSAPKQPQQSQPQQSQQQQQQQSQPQHSNKSDIVK